MSLAWTAARFRFIPVAFLLAIACAWGAMILLTLDPTNVLLWQVNIEATRLFGDAFFLVQDIFGGGPVEFMYAFLLLAAGLAFAGRHHVATRFIGAHAVAVMISLPVLKKAVATAGQDFAYLVPSPWSLPDLSGIEAVRLPLIALALVACLASHAELIARVGRDKAVRERARRLLPA